MISYIFLVVSFIYVYLCRATLENSCSIHEFVFVNKILCIARPLIHLTIIRFPKAIKNLNTGLVLLSYISLSFVCKYMFIILSMITLNAMAIQLINNNAREKESIFAGYFLGRRVITIICTSLLLTSMIVKWVYEIFGIIMVLIALFQITNGNAKAEANKASPINFTRDHLKVIGGLSFVYFILDTAHFFIIKSYIANIETAFLTSIIMFAIILKKHSKIASALLLITSFAYFAYIGNFITPILVMLSAYLSVKTKAFLSDNFKDNIVSINSSSTLMASLLTFIFLTLYSVNS